MQGHPLEPVLLGATVSLAEPIIRHEIKHRTVKVGQAPNIYSCRFLTFGVLAEAKWSATTNAAEMVLNDVLIEHVGTEAGF